MASEVLMARIARLFVPLDVEFATDPKIIAAGPLASYVYLCALAHCKRAGRGGLVHRSQLRFIAPGVHNVAKLAAVLVEVELWDATNDGWIIPAWEKHNLTAEQLDQRKQEASAKSLRGNHQRHHVEKDVKNTECVLCFPVPTGTKNGPAGEEEWSLGKGRGKEEEEEEEEELPTSSSDNFESVETPLPDDDAGIINRIITRVATIRTEKHAPADRGRYHLAVVEQMNRTERHDIAALLLAKPFYRAQADKAADWYELTHKTTGAA